MATNNIKFFLMGNLSTKKVMLEESFGSSKDSEKDAFQIFNRLCMMSSHKFEERSKVSSKNGNIFFTCHLPNKFYLALADSTYSESKVFDLISEVNNSTISESLDKEGKVPIEGKLNLRVLVDKFEKSRDSSIADISHDINDIRIEMKNNVKNLIQNKENAEELQKQSESIKDGGELFAKNANEAKKITCWQNWKLIIIIVLIVIGVLLVIIVPIVTTSSAASTVAANQNTSNITQAAATNSTNSLL